jgi:ribosomal protein S18 acetylase RimI-like enzyme
VTVPDPATEVRPVEPREHLAVADLTAEVYVGGGFSSSDYEPQLRDVASRATAATVLVALRESRLVGSVTVATHGGPWAEQAVPGEAVIRMLAVAEDARGSGAGEALVRACLERARTAGCTVVRLSSQQNMTAAHRLYGRFGFVRTPADDWAPVPGLDLWAYALPLAPWCPQCAAELTPGGHTGCRRAAELDPPRYCPLCRRRMVVQVTPSGWTARCSEHGLRSG